MATIEDEIAAALVHEVQRLLTTALSVARDRDNPVRDAVVSTWSERGRKLNWARPSPFTVLVMSEYGEIGGDPYHYPEVQEAFEFVVAELRKQPFIADAWWESINAAVHEIGYKPIMVA